MATERSGYFPKPGWVWYSTPESFQRGAVSVLAVLETFAAMATYGWIAFRYGTLHLTAAAILAPAFLLRTDRSTQFALNHSKSFRERALRLPSDHSSPARQSITCIVLLALAVAPCVALFSGLAERMSGFFLALSIGSILVFWSAGVTVLAVFVLAPLAMRFVATLHGIHAEPGRAIGNIPRNWWHHVACLDTLHPPEVLPGAIYLESRSGIVSELQPFGYFFAFVRSGLQTRIPWQRRLVRSVPATVAAVGFLSAGVPAYLFRWSIKGTSLLLLPLVWLVYDAQAAKPEFLSKSTLMSGLFKASCAVLVLALGVAVSRLIGSDLGLAEPIQKALAAKDPHGIVKLAFPADRLALWQGVLLFTCVLTISVYLYAERLSVRGYEEDHLHRFRALLQSLGVCGVVLIFALVHTSALIAVPNAGSG